MFRNDKFTAAVLIDTAAAQTIRRRRRRLAHLILDLGVLELGEEPLHGVLLGDAVAETDTASLTLLLGDAVAGAGEDDVEVHAVDADSGVVLDAEVDVLVDAEAEVAGLGEVGRREDAVLGVEGGGEDALGIVAADGDVASDLLVTTDVEGTDSQARYKGSRKESSRAKEDGQKRQRENNRGERGAG